jgi:predicted AAA+ superfamily ATPase
MELLRQDYKVTVGSINGKEIDFVAEKRDAKMYIQVTYVMGSEDTINREFAPLQAIRDNYPKFVISMLDEIDMSRDGIRHVNIREFLKVTEIKLECN